MQSDSGISLRAGVKLHFIGDRPYRQRLTLDQNIAMTTTRWAIRVRNRAGTRLLIVHIELEEQI